ncbi:helix-turn-helix transcriptional regulator, partial [Bordetella muralis]
MSLVQIAKHACLSVNTLQRHFRAVWGKTVFAYLRDARLDRARMALERDAISVTQAALIAGYSSPANFATAFRQRYGIPPG